MKNDIDNTFSCSHSEDFVAYLYDEMPAAEKDEFEKHLLDCGSCTEEFAGLSLARLGVYEYHRDEFASLVTPRIEIPFERPLETVSAVRPSLADVLRGLFAATPKFATSGGAFALVALSLAVGLVLLNFRGGSNDLARSNSANSQSENINRAMASPSVGREVAVTPADPLVPDDDKVSETVLPRSANDRKVGKVSKPAGRTPKILDRKSDARMAETIQKIPDPFQPSAPRLNNFEDEDDTTLRLADLFADVDTRR